MEWRKEVSPCDRLEKKSARSMAFMFVPETASEYVLVIVLTGHNAN